jgi:hypothetical protein
MEPAKKPRYTEFIKELEENRENLSVELEEHVFSNYLRFIEIFKEFREVQSVSIDCYSPCFDAIILSLKDLLSTVKIKNYSNQVSVFKGSPEWWQELPDELDMLIADEKYEECIGVIEDANCLDVRNDCVKFKLDFDVHVLKIVENIASQLQKPQVVLPEVYIGYLKRLDALPAAEDAYFLGKSQQLKQYMRRIAINEYPVEEIPKQCQVFVSLLRNTISETLKLSISVPKLYSWITQEIFAIAWEIGETLHIIEKIEDLAQILSLILKSFDAIEQIGLTLTLTFQKAFMPFVQKRIQGLYLKEETRVDLDIGNEVWKPQVVQVEGSNSVLRVSSSCWSVFQQVLRILQDCCLFYDDHLKCFACLVPIFLKTMQVLLEKFISSDKFDDRKDFKIVQTITCNLWNLASLIPGLCKKVGEVLMVPHMEINDLSIIETEAIVRGNDILHAFALKKWSDEVPLYLTSLQGIPKLLSPDDIKQVFNTKLCLFIKEGLETIASATDRNSARTEKYAKILVEAFLQVLEELLYQIGGHYHINEINFPAFQQFITDLMILNLVTLKYGIQTVLPEFTKKILDLYCRAKNAEEILFKFNEDFYLGLLKIVFP